MQVTNAGCSASTDTGTWDNAGTFALQQQPLLGGKWLSSGAADPNTTAPDSMILSDVQLPSSAFKPVAAPERVSILLRHPICPCSCA